MPTEELDSASRALVEVWHSDGLIENGGFHCFLCAIGDGAIWLAEQYRTVGLHRSADLLLSAHRLWREYWSHPSKNESDPEAFRRQFDAELDRIEEEFVELDEATIDALAQVVKARQRDEV